MIFRPKGSNESFKALGMVGGFGFMMGGTLFGCYLLGDYLDNRYDTSPWLLITLILMGVTSGFMEIYTVLKKLSKNR